MNVRTLAIGLALCSGRASAQDSRIDTKVEETAIRAQIAKRAAYTDDRILWTGALKRPVVGKESAQPFSEAQLAKRRNQKSTTVVDRIEVSASGDMAWDYSHGTLEFDMEEIAGHTKFETASLRVWKKENGQWKVAAAFVRPLDVPFVDH